MLPPVETDESLVAQGTYLQSREGRSTRVQESWTIHSLPDAAQIWRSQLVYNNTVLISSCYLLRAPDARPVQMIFYWRWPEGREDSIEYRFNERYVTLVHRGQEQDMILPTGYLVYGWHTITENFVWAAYSRQLGGSQSFTIVAPGIHEGSLEPSLITMDAVLSQNQIMPGPGGPVKGYVFAIQVPQMGMQEMHFDEFGVPLRWTLPAEGLIVELAQYTRVD